MSTLNESLNFIEVSLSQELLEFIEINMLKEEGSLGEFRISLLIGLIAGKEEKREEKEKE